MAGRFISMQLLRIRVWVPAQGRDDVAVGANALPIHYRHSRKGGNLAALQHG